MKIVDVRYRDQGKAYRFVANDLDLQRGDHVIVETKKGKAFAYVQGAPRELYEGEKEPYSHVLRIATEEDESLNLENLENEKEAKRICKEMVAELGLNMHLVSVEQAFGAKKMTFYFTADDRVDFRQLVKDLAARFHTRIEMRQIGARDETAMCGGIGTCGRELCCCTFLHNFAPISIKMAKAQNLSLNPGKISGTCGRLMCCLRNEAETYEELNKTVPRKGEKIKTPEGEDATVTNLDVLRQKVKVLIRLDEDNVEIREYDASELTFKKRAGKKPTVQKDQDSKNEPKKEGGNKKSRNRKNNRGKGQGKKEGRSGSDSKKKGASGSNSKQRGHSGPESKKHEKHEQPAE